MILLISSSKHRFISLLPLVRTMQWNLTFPNCCLFWHPHHKWDYDLIHLQLYLYVTLSIVSQPKKKKKRVSQPLLAVIDCGRPFNKHEIGGIVSVSERPYAFQQRGSETMSPFDGRSSTSARVKLVHGIVSLQARCMGGLRTSYVPLMFSCPWCFRTAHQIWKLQMFAWFIPLWSNSTGQWLLSSLQYPCGCLQM